MDPRKWDFHLRSLCSHSASQVGPTAFCLHVTGCLVSGGGDWQLLNVFYMAFHANHVWWDCCIKLHFFLIIAFADVNPDFIPSRKKVFHSNPSRFYYLPAMPCNYWHLRQGREDGHFLLSDLSMSSSRRMWDETLLAVTYCQARRERMQFKMRVT